MKKTGKPIHYFHFFMLQYNILIKQLEIWICLKHLNIMIFKPK